MAGVYIECRNVKRKSANNANAIGKHNREVRHLADFELPKTSQRTAVIGRTGSGKTQFGVWLLSCANIDEQPFVIVDFKRDKLVNAIPYAKHITYKDIPTLPGVYILHSSIEELDQLDDFFQRVLYQENIGLFIDETYPIGKNSSPFNMLLTQGRSKNIQMFCLSQRPSWISRFVFSESDFFSVFHLNMRDDEKTIESMTPLDLDEQLPPYYSRWHDVTRNCNFILQPVPDRDTLLSRFEEKLRDLHEENKPKRVFL